MRVTSNSPRQQRRSGLRLWPVGPVLSLAFFTAITVASVVFYAGWDLLGVQGIKTERRLDSSTLFDLVKLSFGVVAGAGALVALIVAYRRQRVDEDGALRDATRLHTERFTAAVGQLGDGFAAVRLGGVHALAGLADDAPTRELRQTCIDVLCAYLRLPYTAETDLPEGDVAARHEYLALREVRHTVIRLVRDHLRHPPEHPRSWQGHDLDFTGVVFDGGDLSHSSFSGGNVSFVDARFSSGISFMSARFSGAHVDFTDATISGGISFMDARFSSGTVWFVNAKLSSGGISFTNARFTGGSITFASARLTGGVINFVRTRFNGGAIHFVNARSNSGAIIFSDAGFGSTTIDFSSALFGADALSFSDGSSDPSTGIRWPVPPGIRIPRSWAPASITSDATRARAATQPQSPGD